MAKGWRKWHWETLVGEMRAHCQIQEDTGCWIWQEGTDKDGYPKLYIDGRHWRGNRAMLMATTGALGEHAMHSCDTPPCVAPHHLRWGDGSENSLDAFAKGRRVSQARPMRGAANGRSKLSDEDRREIVRRSAAGESSRRLASFYGVNRTTVQAVLRAAGASWPTGRPARCSA
jgi:hypothetical protein